MQPDPEHSGQQGAGQSVMSKRRQRVYQHWQGNERFFCWGYLVAGPNWKASFGTAALIMAPTGIYLGFVAPYMGLHVHAVILVISCVLPVLSVWFLMLTACRDPGIIPRQEPDQEYLSGQKPRTRDVYVNNQRVVIRYNDTCHFYQPPRAHHCSVNDNCIERFDHHCPWVGTTIGLRNYRSFLLFVYTSTVLCLYVFGVCVAMLFVKHSELADEAAEAGRDRGGLWGKAAGKCIPALALMGYTFVFFWFVGGLSVFHAYLVATNQTTYENFRYNHDNRPNPYCRGIFANCAEVWCAPIPTSKVKFRAYVDEFKPPTGQPYSPYLNGNGGFGAAPAAALVQADPMAGGGGMGGEMQMSAVAAAGGMEAAAAGSQQNRGQMAPMPPPPPLPAHHQLGGLAAGTLAAAAGVSGGGGMGYGYGPQHSNGGGGGGVPYDPAAMQQQQLPPGGHPYHQQQQQYNLPYNHPANAGGGGGGGVHATSARYINSNNISLDVAPLSGSGGHSHHSYNSDAGAGWGVGGGVRNEQPPASVKGHHGSTFTNQAGGGPGGSPRAGYNNNGSNGGAGPAGGSFGAPSPSGGGGGPSGYGMGSGAGQYYVSQQQHPHHAQRHGGPADPGYGDQYGGGDDEYDEYDDGVEEEDGAGGYGDDGYGDGGGGGDGAYSYQQGHSGSGGRVVRPEHVRPVGLR